MWTYERLGVETVVNAAGRLTRLGGVSLAPEVSEAMTRAAASYVDIEALKDRASRQIADWLGAESAWITAGAAAGIVTMVAAVVAGSDPWRIEQIPNVDWEPREILIPGGHLVNFGASISQMVRLGGGSPVPFGWTNLADTEQLAAALKNRKAAAVLYVASHHAVQKGILRFSSVVEACREGSIPVLVDAAAEEDLTRYIEAGADVVAYSGGKAIGGPTSGILAGRKALIDACRAQDAGVTRPMKVSKETVMGLVTALDLYLNGNSARIAERRRGVAESLLHSLESLPHTKVNLEPDEAGRDIVRVAVRPDPDALGFDATDLEAALREGQSPIFTRTHWLSRGILLIDPRSVDEEDAHLIDSAIKAFYDQHAGQSG